MKTIGILAIVMLIGSMFAFPVSALSYSNPADVNNDGYVDKKDLLLVFRHWGDCSEQYSACIGDVNSDETVNVEDMTAVIFAWNPKPAPKEPKSADLNGDGVVGTPDLILLMEAWGECGSYECPADFDYNGKVDQTDLNILMKNWTVDNGERQASWNEISKEISLDNIDKKTLKELRRVYLAHYLRQEYLLLDKNSEDSEKKYERPSVVPTILSDKAPEKRPDRPYIQTPKPVERPSFRVPTILSNVLAR